MHLKLKIKLSLLRFYCYNYLLKFFEAADFDAVNILRTLIQVIFSNHWYILRADRRNLDFKKEKCFYLILISAIHF